MSDRNELRTETDPERWNTLVDGSPHRYFSQLWEWGEIQRSIGWQPWRLVLGPADGAGVPVAASQLLVRRLPGTDWGIAHAPRGPVLGRTAGTWEHFEAAVTQWARQNRIATLVVDPDVSADSYLGRALMRPPWRAAPMLGEPTCHIVALGAEDELWSRVRRKHREWIRRADRSDIEIQWIDGRSSARDAERGIGLFQQVYAEISRRIGVPLKDPEYYRLMWETLRHAGRAHLVTATANGTPAGAMLHFTCGDEMIWFAGGQTAEGTPLGVGKLLVWRSMVRAGELGYRRYNMWGTATEGLAHFKLGFGAREESYVGTRSIALNATVDRIIRSAWRARDLVRRLRRQ